MVAPISNQNKPARRKRTSQYGSIALMVHPAGPLKAQFLKDPIVLRFAYCNP